MNRAKTLPGYWYDRLAVNAEAAIFHQWEQLEASGSIENFRIAAGKAEGFREGWFFADSDAYKWLDAAVRVHATRPSPRLAALMDEFIALIDRAQKPDGYIYTYNQVHFPGTRWTNLQVEHELYCHGHLIEAGVSHHEATGRSDLLEIALQAADRIVADFRGKGPQHTPGHQEIEIALLRLYRLTGQADYLDMASQFIEQRGRQRGFGLAILRQNSSAEQRKETVRKRRQEGTCCRYYSGRGCFSGQSQNRRAATGNRDDNEYQEGNALQESRGTPKHDLSPNVNTRPRHNGFGLRKRTRAQKEICLPLAAASITVTILHIQARSLLRRNAPYP